MNARIAIASSGLGHVNRGIEAWAEDLGAALANRGVPILLFKGAGTATKPYEQVIGCWTRESPTTRFLLRILPKRLSWRLGFGSGYTIEQTTFALKLIRWLKRERVDILHVQDPHVATIIQWAQKRGWVSTRTILAHGTEEPGSFLKTITYLQHLAPWHLEQHKNEGVWKPTWTAIPNFIDTERFQPGRSEALRAELGIPPEGLVVLTAAAIKRGHKRIDYLIDEFANFREQYPHIPAWLVVAGGWENDTDELMAEGKRRLGDRVRFLVRFPRTRMPELYRIANVFALCSLFEMMPIALIEATASGLPCLVNRHPILEWMAGPGGMPVDMSRTGELAAALGKALSDPAKLAELSKAARAHCLAHFSQNAVVDQILDYYQQVLKPDQTVDSKQS